MLLRTLQAEEKVVVEVEKRTSGAKARRIFSLTARLKSCPDTKQSFFRSLFSPGERLLPLRLQIPPVGRDDKVRVVVARSSGQRKKHPLRHSHMPFSYEKPKWLQLDPWRPGERLLPQQLQIPHVGRNDKVRAVMARSSGQRKKHPLRHQPHAFFLREAEVATA